MNSNAATTNDSTSPEPPPVHTNNQLIDKEEDNISQIQGLVNVRKNYGKSTVTQFRTASNHWKK
jgi:hypothetical protein